MSIFDLFEMPLILSEPRTIVRRNYGWTENATEYTMLINDEKPEISVDENTIYINFKSVDECGYYKYNKVISYPENSIHNTLKAKRTKDGKVLLSIEKENKRTTISIED